MPLPVSPHRPEFTEEQLAQARRIAQQHTAPHRAVLRARLTLLLAENPEISHREAARRAGLRYSTVYKMAATLGQRQLVPRRCSPTGPPVGFFPLSRSYW